jgi:hypothetical protein
MKIFCYLLNKAELMMYFCAMFLVFSFFNQALHAANQERRLKPLVGLAKMVHEATPLPSVLREEVLKYVGIYKLWESELSTNDRCFVRRLSDQEFAVVEQNGRINILDAATGNRKRSVRSHHKLHVQYAEALSPQHVILALKKGKLRVVDLNEKGNSSSFVIPDTYKKEIRGLELLKSASTPEVVIGCMYGDLSWTRRSSIFAFNIDLQNRTWKHKRHDIDGSLYSITTLPDGKVRFVHGPQDCALRHGVCTLDIETGNKEWMDRSAFSDSDMVRGVMGNNNFFVLAKVPCTERERFMSGQPHAFVSMHIRKGKRLEEISCGSTEYLSADLPEGFVTGYNKELLVRDDDCNVVQELLKNQKIEDVKYLEGGLLAAASSGNNGTKISAWQI